MPESLLAACALMLVIEGAAAAARAAHVARRVSPRRPSCPTDSCASSGLASMRRRRHRPDGALCVSGCFPSTSTTSFPPRPRRSSSCGARCSITSASTATGWCSRRWSSTSSRCSPAPGTIWTPDVQGRRSAVRPPAGRARGHHAAGRAHRRAPAQRARRHAAVLRGQRAAHHRGRRSRRRAKCCRSAPSSTAMRASMPTARCSALLLSSLAAVGVRGLHLDLGHVGVYRALANGARIAGDGGDSELFAALRNKDVPAVSAAHGAAARGMARRVRDAADALRPGAAKCSPQRANGCPTRRRSPAR